MQDYYKKQGVEIKEQMEAQAATKLEFLQKQLDEKSKEALKVTQLEAEKLKLEILN